MSDLYDQMLEAMGMGEPSPKLPPAPDEPNVWMWVKDWQQWNDELRKDSSETDYVYQRARFYYQLLEQTELPNAIERDNIKYYPDDPIQMGPFGF